MLKYTRGVFGSFASRLAAVEGVPGPRLTVDSSMGLRRAGTQPEQTSGAGPGHRRTRHPESVNVWMGQSHVEMGRRGEAPVAGWFGVSIVGVGAPASRPTEGWMGLSNGGMGRQWNGRAAGTDRLEGRIGLSHVGRSSICGPLLTPTGNCDPAASALETSRIRQCSPIPPGPVGGTFTRSPEPPPPSPSPNAHSCPIPLSFTFSFT
jgi:hypothetical protein